DRVLLLRHHRPDVDVPLRRVAHTQRLRALDDAVDEAVGHLAHDVDALDPRAGLAGVREPAPQAAGDRVLEVRVGEHDLGVLAAELEHRALHPLRALDADLPAGLDRAREEHLGHARLDYGVAHLAVAVNGAHDPVG